MPVTVNAQSADDSSVTTALAVQPARQRAARTLGTSDASGSTSSQRAGRTLSASWCEPRVTRPKAGSGSPQPVPKRCAAVAPLRRAATSMISAPWSLTAIPGEDLTRLGPHTGVLRIKHVRTDDRDRQLGIVDRGCGQQLPANASRAAAKQRKSHPAAVVGGGR